ncbi:MAG: hypothetical protein BWY83_02509 [bacterium ADurb.Bin478]|nr:MAG: hypothetical protein BWY83_02509 [bacterium ADurb.Bin478]
MQADHILHAAAIIALRRNGADRAVDDAADLFFKKRGAVQRGDEHAAVHAVAVIHDVADLVRHPVRGPRHGRTDKADIVGFDLEIDIVAMEVVRGAAGLGRQNAVLKIFPRLYVGVPQLVAGCGKGFGELGRRRIQTPAVHGHHKAHLHIEVILFQCIGDPLRAPGQRLIVGFPLSAELGRRAVRNADHLAGPTTGHFIAQLFQRDSLITRLSADAQ